MNKLISGILVIVLTIFHIATSQAETWSTTKLSNYNGPVNCLNFIDNQTGFVGGNLGSIFKTTDGTSWLLVNSSLQINYSSISFANALTGYASSMVDGGVMKTTDGGNNWFLGSGSLPYGCFGIYASSPTTAIVCGGWGSIFKTINGGSNWISYGVNYHANLTGITASSTGKLFITSELINDTGHCLWTSTNGGVNWVSNPFNSLTAFAITFSGPNGFMVGSGISGAATICKTTNDGASFSSQSLDTGIGTFFSISFANANTGYAVGTNYGNSSRSFCYKTTDAGNTWNLVFQKSGLIYVTDCTSNRVYLGCDSGNVFSTPLIDAIQSISSEVPKIFALGQNYPNPFNPTTNINISVKENGNVKMTVFDVSGKEVAVLVNQIMKPGTYKVDFNASNFSSGVYFYRISTSTFTETKKMVLVK